MVLGGQQQRFANTVAPTVSLRQNNYDSVSYQSVIGCFYIYDQIIRKTEYINRQ